jgi:hypothetical protein
MFLGKNPHYGLFPKTYDTPFFSWQTKNIQLPLDSGGPLDGN